MEEAKAKVYLPDFGAHNADLEGSQLRLVKGATYRDLSTIIIVPTRGLIPGRVVQSWLQMLTPMNGKLMRIPSLVGEGMEVGAAYSQMVDMILAHPFLSTFKFLLTLEEDNIPPPDGLLKLIETIYEGPWAAVGGLYWTKGEAGQPMIYGDPKVLPLNFLPQLPCAGEVGEGQTPCGCGREKHDPIVECRGLGMGFTLFDINLFRDPDLPRPLFRTVQEVDGHNTRQGTQDLVFYEAAARVGYRFACDCRVRVGHYDYANDKVW
jgi:hypothetical protein